MTSTDDAVELRALSSAYAAALDQRDAAALVDAFTPNGRLTAYRPNAPAPHFDFHGRAEIATLLERLERYELTFHLVGNHRCAVDGATATGETYSLAHHIGSDEDGAYVRVAAIRYDDAYARIDGRWLIDSRIIRRLWAERRATT